MTTRTYVGYAAAAALAVVTTLSGCGGGGGGDESSFAVKGQPSLEVYAELTQSGIAAITQMQNGQLIIGYHPFYLTPTTVQVATLNADRKSSTPYPPAGSGLLQSCRNTDGSFLPAQNGRYDFCLDWVLGFHADANGILWILDGAKSTEKATGAGTVRPAALHAKYVGWDTKTNKLFKVLDLDSVTIASSQHNDFAIDPKHGAQGTLIAADEAVGDANNAALVVTDIATGTSRRLLHGNSHVIANSDPIRWDAQAGQPAASWNLGVGVDGADLANHRCLAWLSRDQPKAQWSFVSPEGSTETIAVTPVLCGDSLVVRQWAVSGEGVAYKASVDVAADLRAGRLVRLLAQYEGEAVPISALMPSGRFVPARVRTMVDYLAQRFAESGVK